MPIGKPENEHVQNISAHPVPDVELPIVYELKKPIKVSETVYTEVSINREPTANDFLGITLTALKTDDFVKILSRLTGLTPLLFKTMHYGDFVYLQNRVNAFLPDLG